MSPWIRRPGGRLVRAGAFAFALAVGAQTPAAGAAEDLRTELQAILEAEGLAGAAWALVHADGSITTDAAGYRDNVARTPFSKETRFHVGSLAKTVLATGVLRLASEERIHLDAPVNRYLPAVALRNPWAAESPVTVRHLLDHTSGLEDMRLWHMFSTRIATDTPLAETFARSTDSLQIRSRPGSRFSYSNTAYTLLGMVIEAVAGQPYERYLDEQLLAPLGMGSSTFRFTTQEGPAADPTLAWGHLDNGARAAALPIMVRPAGQFTTTAHDFGVFARFLMGDGRINGNPFIHPELMRARGRAANTEAARAGLRAGYSLGLGSRDRDGSVGYGHSGNVLGFMAMMSVYPEVGKAYAVAINTDSETAKYGRVFEALARHLGAPRAVPSGLEPFAGEPAEWEGFYVLEPARFQSFAYVDNVLGVARARWRDGDLVLSTLGRQRRLRPAGGQLLVAHDRVTESHVLLRDAAGGHLMSDGFSTYRKAGVLTLAARWSSFTLGVLGVAWFLVSGVIALRLGRAAWARPEMVAFVGVFALLLPLPLFLRQSFTQLGDPTAASLFLAAVTGALPLAVAATLWKLARTRPRTALAYAHGFWAVAVLQWCVALASWGLLPVRLWA